MAFAPRTVQNMPDWLAAGTNDGFAARFDKAGADEQVLGTELRVSHAFLVVINVVGFGANLLQEFLVNGDPAFLFGILARI